MIRKFFPTSLPSSLLGQMLLAVAAALLAAQTISAVLLYRAAEQRHEIGAANALAFQLLAVPSAPRGERPGRRWRRFRLERSDTSPLRPGEDREPHREEMLRSILTDQGLEIGDLVVATRPIAEDTYSRQLMRQGPQWRRRHYRHASEVLVAGLRLPSETEYIVARFPVNMRHPGQIGLLIMHTLLLYVVLVGGLAILLRRITQPLAALTNRVETFTETREATGQLEPSGPQDTRRLIAAHNAMEGRIVALLDEKDVMLGAIGHDLKTPLAALRVRIESVEDTAERAKMAATIEDITRSLDDILSLARVGRANDPLERTDLSALVASVVEEYEDMGEPVELAEAERMATPLRATWLRRALRNLISNAVRYGKVARVSLYPDNGEAVIRIDDDGPGIPADQIDAMMEPFARGEISRNRETGGAGLGLTLARAIAEQHGGTLTLTNRPEGGLQAEFRLPTG